MTDPYTPLTLSQARDAADLSVGQAAILAGLSAARLRTVEAHPAELTAQEWLIFARLYDADPERFMPCPKGPARRVIFCADCGALWLAGDPPLCERPTWLSASQKRALRFAYAPVSLEETPRRDGDRDAYPFTYVSAGPYP